MADALDKKCDTVLTCGGIQSNHCRSTAVAARQLGLNCYLFLRNAEQACQKLNKKLTEYGRHTNVSIKRPPLLSSLIMAWQFWVVLTSDFLLLNVLHYKMASKEMVCFFFTQLKLANRKNVKYTGACVKLMKMKKKKPQVPLLKKSC